MEYQSCKFNTFFGKFLKINISTLFISLRREYKAEILLPQVLTALKPDITYVSEMIYCCKITIIVGEPHVGGVKIVHALFACLYVVGGYIMRDREDIAKISRHDLFWMPQLENVCIQY